MVALRCTDANHQQQELSGWPHGLNARLSTAHFGPQILKVPSDIEYNGRGPLVSARLVDTDLLWARGKQVTANTHAMCCSTFRCGA